MLPAQKDGEVLVFGDLNSFFALFVMNKLDKEARELDEEEPFGAVADLSSEDETSPDDEW